MKEKNKNIIAAAVILLLAALCILGIVSSKRGSADPVCAEIIFDGEVIRKIDLQGAKDEVFSLTELTGKNITLEIKDSAVRFVSSDCPDLICVNTGFVKNETESAVCLPNRTAVVITAK